MDYDFIPQAYKQFEEEEDETTKRGVLDRVLSPLMNTSVTSALYNITDDDPDTTFLGGIGAGLSRQLNPLKDDVSDTHTAADVLDNIFGEADSFAGKVARGVGGFVGDVVLDPMTYVSGGVSAAGKILRGTGTKTIGNAVDAVEAANNILNKGVTARKTVRYNDCVDIVKKKYSKIPNAEAELNVIIEAEAKSLYEQFNKKVSKVVNEEAMKGEGISVGLANLPFASKLKQGKKADNIFYRELVTEKQLREFGDKTVSPYYNAISDTIRQTKVMRGLSNNNKLFTESQADMVGALSKFSTQLNLNKTATAKADAVYKAAANLEVFRSLDTETQETLNRAYREGTLDDAIEAIKFQKNIQEKMLKNHADYTDDVIEKAKAKKAELDEKYKFYSEARETLKEAYEYRMTPTAYARGDFRGVDTLTEIDENLDLNKIDIFDISYEDDGFTRLLKKLVEDTPEALKESDIGLTIDDIIEDDVINFFLKGEGATPTIKQIVDGVKTDVVNERAVLHDSLMKDLVLYFNRAKEIEKSSALQYPPYIDRWEDEIKKIEDFLSTHNVTPENEKKLLEGQKTLRKKLRAALKDIEGEAHARYMDGGRFDQLDALSVGEKLKYIKDQLPEEEYNKFLDNIKFKYEKELIEDAGVRSDNLEHHFTADKTNRLTDGTPDAASKVTTSRIDPEPTDYREMMFKDGEELTDDSAKFLRKMLNDMVGSGRITRYKYGDLGYALESSRTVFNEKNLDNRSAFVIKQMIVDGNYTEATELLRDIAASGDYKLTYGRINEKLKTHPLTIELAKKTGAKELNITSPSVLRYDIASVPIANSERTVRHSRPIYRKWKEVEDIIEHGRLDVVAANGKTHRANIMELGGRINPDYSAGSVKPMSDGSIPSSLQSKNNFVIDNIKDLVKFDDETNKLFDDIQSLRNKKRKTEELFNASDDSMKRASEQSMQKHGIRDMEYTNSAEVSSKHEGTTIGSGVVNFEKNLYNIYGEDCGNFIKENQPYVLRMKNHYTDMLEEELGEMVQTIMKAPPSAQDELRKKYSRLAYQYNTLKYNDDLDVIADTDFIETISKIYSAMDTKGMFSLKGEFAPEGAKKCTNLNDIIAFYAKELKFEIRDDIDVSDNAKKILKKYDVKPDEEVVKKKVSSVRRLKKNPEQRLTIEDLDKIVENNEIPSLKNKASEISKLEAIIDKADELITVSEPSKRGMYRAAKEEAEARLNEIRVSISQGVVDKDKFLHERAERARKSIAEKGFSDVRFDKSDVIDGLLPDDIMHIINAAHLENKKHFNDIIRNMGDAELDNFLKNAPDEQVEAAKDVLFNKALFDDWTLTSAKYDENIKKYCIDRYTSVLESIERERETLDAIIDLGVPDNTDVLRAYADLAYMDSASKSRDTWDNLIKVLQNMSDEQITTFSGMQKTRDQIIKELDALGNINKFNYAEMMEDILPRTMSEEAQKYMRELKPTEHNIMSGITPKMSIEDANKIIKQRTGVEKWYNDSIAEAFTGFMIQSGKDIQQSGTVNQILHSFGKKYFAGQAVKEGDTVVVKSGALRNYIAKAQGEKLGKQVYNADFSELEKYGLRPDEVKYSSMFVEMDADTYNKIAKDFKTGDNTLSAWTMSKENTKMFNQAAHYQNVESETAFWKMYDKFLTVYKTVNTVPNPGFHINNAIGNAFNSFLYCGAAALNPHKINIARTIIKNPDPKQYINIGGKQISYQDMNQMFKSCGVTGGYFDAEATKEITEHWRMLPGIKQGLRIGTEIEEIQRGTLFIEAMMNGNTPSEAMDIVNQFLFDYADLTPEETKFMKRLIPFYTFMRKNVPLQLKEMMEQPELYRNLTKGISNIERLSGADYIRDEDRSEWRKDYIQVPFKIDGKSFGFDPNLPYQQLDRLTPSKLIGQMTPAIKAPIELATGHYAYTGMPIESLDEYAINQFSIPRAVAVTAEKEGPDKTLYPIGQLTGMPMGTIKDLSDF